MRKNIEVLIRKLTSIADLTSDDCQTLSDLEVRIVELDAREDFAREGDVPGQCCFIIDGFMQRYQDLPSGKRQILAFHTPGDMPDLQNLSLEIMDHNIAAVVRCKVGIVSHASLLEIMRKSPNITQALWRDTLIDGAIFRAWLTSMGQRSAYDHFAHLLCEVFTRLRAVGLATENWCALPVTQEQLGEALGISTVHVNRTLMDLRRAELIEFAKGRLTILDWEGLVAAAQFDPAYLHLRKPAAV